MEERDVWGVAMVSLVPLRHSLLHTDIYPTVDIDRPPAMSEARWLELSPREQQILL